MSVPPSGTVCCSYKLVDRQNTTVIIFFTHLTFASGWFTLDLHLVRVVLPSQVAGGASDDWRFSRQGTESSNSPENQGVVEHPQLFPEGEAQVHGH